MSGGRGHSTRRMMNVLSGTFYDIPVWARGLLVTGGLAGVVLACVASLEGGVEETIEVDKLLHFSGYMTLAAVFVLGLRPALYLPVLVLLALLGLAIEYFQPFNGRSRDWYDAVANVAGLAAGTMIGLVLRVAARTVGTMRKESALRQQRRVYSPGAIIVRQGVPAKRFFVIEHGEVQCLREIDGQKQTLGKLGPGDVFGLIGVLQSTPQYTTVEAASTATVYSLELKDLVDSTDGRQEPVAIVLKCLAKYLQVLGDRVIDAEASMTAEGQKSAVQPTAR